MNSDFETIKSMITCLYCGEIFKKENKALILKCAHSICQYCHKINLDCLTCLVCKVKYVGKENLNHPINFLLVEFLEKEDLIEYLKKCKSESKNDNNNNNTKEEFKLAENEISKNEQTKTDTIETNNSNKSLLTEDLKRFYCSNCNLFFRNEFHFENENSKCKLSKKDLAKNLDENSAEKNKNDKKSQSKNLTKAEILERDSNQLMKKYNEFNAEINELYEDYIKSILINYICSQKILRDKINTNKIFENLIMGGFITENHFNKMLNFMLKYHKNKKLMKLIKDYSNNCLNKNEIEKESKFKFNSKEKFENFINELYSIENNCDNFKANDFLSEYFFFKSVLDDFKDNMINKLERLESLFTLNKYEIKEIEEDERKFKNKQAKDICEIFNRDMMQNLISEISNDINFSQQKNIANIKYSYFFIKKNKHLSKKDMSLIDKDLIVPNNLNLIVFDPLTETLKKLDLELLIIQIQELYEKYKVNYSKDCLKIKHLKRFDFNDDQFGNIFLYGGYFKKIKRNAESDQHENEELIINDRKHESKINNNNNINENNSDDHKQKTEFEYIKNNLIFKINPFKKKFKVFHQFANPKFGSASIIINKDFFFLGGKSFKNFLDEKTNKKFANANLKEYKQNKYGKSFKVLNLKNFTLTALEVYPLELKAKPLILNHVYENVFVCEDIRNFSFFNLKKKKWKKSQIFYNSENITNISNFIGFNFNKEIILLGGIKNIKKTNLSLNNENYEEDIAFEKDIKVYNDQILSVEREYYSVSNFGYSIFHFADLYEKKFGKNKIQEIARIESEIAYLSDTTYILEHHKALGMIYIRKNTRLKSGLDFDSFKLEKIDEI